MDSDNNQGGFLVKSSLKMLGSQYCLSIFNIFCFMYLLRVLTHVEIASIAIFEILTSIYGFSELGLNSVMIKFCPSGLKTDGDSYKAYGLIKLTILVQGVVLFCMVGITYFFAAFISYQFLKTDIYAWAVIIISPGAALTILFSTLRGIAKVGEMYSLIARWIFLAGFLKQSIAISCYLVYGFKGYIIGLTVSSIIPVVGISISIRNLIFNPSPLSPFWKTLRYSFPLYIRSFMRYGFKEFDQPLIGLLSNPEILAIYSVARRFINYLNQIIEFFSMPIMMRSLSLIDAPIDNIQVFAKETMRYLFYLLIPACICFALASPWLMAVYGGYKYFSGWPILSLLAISQLLYSFSSMISIYVFALKSPKFILILEGAIGLCNYCFSPLFITLIGIYGVIFGQMIGFIVGIIVATYMLRPKHNIRIQWSELRILIMPLLISIAVVLSGMYLCFNLWLIPFYFVLAAILYLISFCNKLNESDWKYIRSITPEKLSPIIEYLYRR